MKHLILATASILLIAHSLMAQDSLQRRNYVPKTTIRNYDYYFEKSKTLIPIGYVLIGAGAVAAIVGTITFINSYDIIDACGSCFVTAGLGIGAVSAGIPLLVKGYVFKRRANMILKSENIQHSYHAPVKANLISAGIAISF